MASQDPVAGPAEPDSAALLRAAARAGEQVSERLLETFRAQGLIPRPRRVGNRGRTPLWRYPLGTERQLVAMLRWRQHAKDPDLLKVLLWLDGFPVPDAAVREALLCGLHAMTGIIEREIDQRAQRLGLEPADGSARGRAISELAHTAAGKRGNAPVPRHRRVRASDRAHAVSLMFRLFGLGEKIETTAQDAELVERVLGLAPNGRRRTIDGTGPWLTGPAEDLFTAAEITAIPNLATAVTDASGAELATARQMVSTLFRHLPLMVRMTGAMFGDENYTGLAGLRQLDQHPEAVIYLVPMVIGMIRAGWAENLEAVTSALRPFPELAAQAERILGMPHATVEANLAAQPADVRARAHRIIDAAVEGEFDIGPTGPSCG
jgi:hypothetical protein